MSIRADEVAAAVVRELATHPDSLAPVVDRIATAVIARLGDEYEIHPKNATTDDSTPAVQTHESTADGGADDTAAALAEWAQEHAPEWVLGDPEQWSRDLVRATGGEDPKAVLEWAHSETCPTAEWRDTRSPLTPPALTKRGEPRQSRYTQMLQEYRLANSTAGADTVGAIDPLISQVCDVVAGYGLVDDLTPQPSWRRNAIDIIGVCAGDANVVVEAITWAMRHKPHWRSNVRGIPAKRSFLKLFGDYRAAGGGFTLDRLDPELAAAVEDLARGWTWYVANALGRNGDIPVTTESRHRIWQMLTGRDGGTEVTADEIKNVTRWIFDPQAGRARFYTVGESFPPPQKIRKALVDRAAAGNAGGNGVGVTNQLAGDDSGSRGETTVTVRGV